MDIGTIVREYRESRRLSQEGLARNLGVSFTTVNRLENGKTKPRKALLSNLKEQGVNISEQNQPDLPKAFSFFSGADGFGIGIEKAGFRTVFATDIDIDAERTHLLNWPDIPFLRKDIREITKHEILKLTKNISPDLIYGGPPCQGFSTLGDKRSSDPRNQLFDSYFKLIESLNPKYILMENVKALITMYSGQYASYIKKRLITMGFRIFVKILNAADYGVPQFRERVIFFGTKSNNNFAFPKITHGERDGLLPFATVGKYISDLTEKGEADIPNHIALRHSETVIRRYKIIPEGGRLPPPNELPPEIRRLNFGNTYKRLDRSKPSLTLVPGNNAFPIHPTLHRSLTPREAARLQTFSDSFVFLGDRRKQCILVGNAVPPVLGKVIGDAIQDHINNKTDICDKEEYLAFDEKKVLAKSANIFSGLKVFKLDDSMGFLDLFSGAGGITIGFTKGGFKPLLSVDFNDSVKETHLHNFPNISFIKGDLSNQKLVDEIIGNYKTKNIAIIAGGPPCQGFSIFGKRRFVNSGFDPHDDKRNELVFSFIKFIEGIRPRWFVMENVPGLVSLDNGDFFSYIIKEYRRIGYFTEAKIINCADYGAPQIRKRLLVIGNRTGHIIPWPRKKYFERPADWQKPHRTAGEVLTDLSVETSYGQFTCHVPMKHKDLLIERYKYIPEGGILNVDALPDKLKKGYRTEEVKNYSHVFKRLHRMKPSITMVPGHNAFPIHPWLNRALTVREAARIQTFPDEIEFKGTRQEQCIQVGNAFPPIVAEYIANNILKAEKNGWYPNKVNKNVYYSVVEQDDPDELTKDI
jgi:DNA (cytosine-5)-methyltransferase 1